MIRYLALCAGATLAVASGANAFCLYHGVDNAKTTLAQEFRDAKWVVRARAISGDYHWANAGDLWTLYHLTIIRSYKGRAPVHLALFTWRDSGGFYLDGKEAAPDFDHDYLLFLTPAIRRRGDPLAMRGAMWVNYECGQSRPWSRVSRADAVRLQAMSRRMPIAAGK